MNERRKIEDKIRKKEAEIQEFELRAREAKIYVQALSDVLKMIPREVDMAAGDSQASLRDGSSASLARAIIMKAGRPVHLRDLLVAMGKEATRENRTSLASSLAAYVRKGEIFTRPAPGRFGLIELAHTATARPRPGPPPGFGRVDDSDGSD